MPTRIHPTAIVGKKAKLGTNVAVGPYSIIEDNVRIGNDTTIGNFTTIKAGTTIGKECQIFHNCSIGEIPQDIKYKGEDTQVRIGDRVAIREFVTINRGTAAHGVTTVGNHTMLMASVHIAHDCQLGDNVIFANLVTLGGHVEVDHWATLGGCVLVHQFCRIGTQVFVGGGFRIVQDVPPFILAAGEPLRYTGINRVGLKRRGFTTAACTNMKKAYRLYFRSDLSRAAALEKIKEEFVGDNNIDCIIDFILSSSRGII